MIKNQDIWKILFYEHTHVEMLQADDPDLIVYTERSVTDVIIPRVLENFGKIIGNYANLDDETMKLFIRDYLNKQSPPWYEH